MRYAVSQKLAHLQVQAASGEDRLSRMDKVGAICSLLWACAPPPLSKLYHNITPSLSSVLSLDVLLSPFPMPH